MQRPPRARELSLSLLVWSGFGRDFDFLLLRLDLVKKKTRRSFPMAIRGIFAISTAVLLLFLLTINHGEAIWLTIPATGGTKCVSEEIQSNVVVLADYYVVDEQNPGNTPAVSAKVRRRIGLSFKSCELSIGRFSTDQEQSSLLRLMVCLL